ncbi:MAG: chaperone NapD [Gammaproteobacteria bacterium]|jgi:nitrate reductase NapD
MNVSGILVIVPTRHVTASIETLGRMEGVDVHHCDPETGRIVVTQEAETVPAEVNGLKRIKGMPHVILAEMVYHCFEEDSDPTENIPADLDKLEGVTPVPPFLNK